MAHPKDAEQDEIFIRIRPALWDTIVPSYFQDSDNPRIDAYQTIKICRVILFCLKDINERLEKIEKVNS